MLTIQIICIGKLKEVYWREAISEYSKRMKPFCKFNIVELEEYRVPKNPSQSEIDECLRMEGKRIISKIPPQSEVLSLCIEGKTISSEALSKKIECYAVNGISNVSFIIGGSWGLSDEVKNISKLKLSISPMTFPHQLARVMLCEQIYRAFQISSNSEYHK